jgi:translation initiation factor 2B subunit (eIF-2B alpha/beta/delta family)
MKLAEKSFAVTPQMAKEMAAAMRKMQEATKNLSERNSSKATQAQKSSMASMNKAALTMQSMMSQMQQQGQCNNPGGQGEDGKDGTGGQQQFMEGLQQMAMQQQGLNQAMQQMQKGKGGKLSPEQQGEMKRMASQQGRIRQSAKNRRGNEKNSRRPPERQYYFRNSEASG